MIKKFSKYHLLLFLFITQIINAGEPPASKAVGVFLATGVGARFPLSEFANSTNLGYGLMLDLEYTDTDYLPFFIFARFGYEQFPGSQDFYQESDYSNYSTTVIPLSLGIRYYFAPLVESAVLLIPVIEGSVSYSYFQVLNQFKIDSGQSSYTDHQWKFGGTVGAGISMFLLEIMAYYTYYESAQYLSFNLNVRLPIFVNM